MQATGESEQRCRQAEANMKAAQDENSRLHDELCGIDKKLEEHAITASIAGEKAHEATTKMKAAQEELESTKDVVKQRNDIIQMTLQETSQTKSQLLEQRKQNSKQKGELDKQRDEIMRLQKKLKALGVD